MTISKVAVITGASQGIGRVVAKGLAEDGYNVILIARTKEKLQALQNEIKSLPVKSEIIACDITHTQELLTQLDRIINDWGRVDVLVNNAGIYLDGSLEPSLDEYQHLFNVNFTAQLILIKKILPIMQAQKSGYIFNIASIAGVEGYAHKGAYCSTKFALVGLSESLSKECRDHGVKVTAICPCWAASEMTEAVPISSSEMIQKSDILQTIRWLLQLSPSAFVNQIVIDSYAELKSLM